MIRPSDNQSPIAQVHSFEKNFNNFLSQLRKVSQCIQKLSSMVAPDDDERCLEFKQKQLYHLLSGDGLSADELRNSEIATEMLKWADSGESHLGVLHARDTGCHYPELSDESEVSALNLHGPKGWCIDCTKGKKQHEPNFSSGRLNPFACWRRGHQSRKLGFVQFSRLQNIGRDGGIGVSLSSTKVYTQPALGALIHNQHRKIPIDTSSGLSAVGGSMTTIFVIDSEIQQEVNLASEIKRILPAQLLVSRHIDISEDIRTDYIKDVEDKIPERLAEILEKTHGTWIQHGLSQDSNGILGLALVNNRSHYAKNDALQNTLENFSERYRIWFRNYDLDKLPDSLKDELKLSDETIPVNCSGLCIMLDPIVDLGGVQV